MIKNFDFECEIELLEKNYISLDKDDPNNLKNIEILNKKKEKLFTKIYCMRLDIIMYDNTL